MTSLPAPLPVQSPTSARQARADRYLARVATLTPRQWGELDAIGQRFAASDPIAWWERSRRLSAFASFLPVVEDVLSVVGVVGMGIEDAARALRRKRGVYPRFTHFRRTSVDAETWEIAGRIETLWDVAVAQPGGAGASFDCLAIGLVALWMRDRLPERGFARLYELVEPVIPAASI